MTPYFRQVITDPVDRSALTVEVWTADGRAYARVGMGPGTGPHVTTSPQTLRDWVWLIEQACDAFDAAQTDTEASRGLGQQGMEL